MTELLTQAFEKASKLPDDLQDHLALEVLEEIEWESRWDQTLAGSQDKLERLAEKAAKEYRAGKTKEMGFDELRSAEDRAKGGEDRQEFSLVSPELPEAFTNSRGQGS